MITSIKLITCSFIAAAALMSTGCPRNAPNLDLSSESVRSMAVTQMKTNVFPDEYAQYQCWVNGRKVVPKYKRLAASDITKGRDYVGKREGDMAYDTFFCDPLGTGETIDTNAKAKEIRNRVFRTGQGIIDEVFFKYSTALRTKRSREDFVLDLIDIGLGASIGWTKGKAQTIRDLGIGLIAFRAGRNSSVLRLYDNQTTDIILDQMDTSRSEVYINFANNDSIKTVAEYPIEAVFTDLYKYYAVGSQTEAFKRLRRKTAASAETAEKAVLKIKSLTAEQMYAPTIAEVAASLDYGDIKDEFYNAIKALQTEADAEKKKTELEKINTKLVVIFKSITEGSDKAKFEPYIKAVLKQTEIDFAEVNRNFLKEDVTLTTEILNARMNFLEKIGRELTNNTSLGKTPTLRAVFYELFKENKLD